ncbi:hypothetical protein CQA15_29265, partial [Klebsiella pneumoniae]
KDLEIKTLLMDEQDHGYALTGDALSQAAIAAANRSHMPYSEAHALRDYLPDAFGPKDLEIKTLLMDEQDHGYALTGDALSQAAIAAA